MLVLSGWGRGEAPEVARRTIIATPTRLGEGLGGVVVGRVSLRASMRRVRGSAGAGRHGRTADVGVLGMVIGDCIGANIRSRIRGC